MRLLLVSYYFPPYNCAGAVRTGETARLLGELGHEVHVISAIAQPLAPTLPLEIAADQVTYTKWLGARLAPIGKDWLPAASSPRAGRGDGATKAARRSLLWLSRNAMYVPDNQIGWYPFALRAAFRLARRRRVDLIYASAWPFTSLLTAATLGSLRRIPWVAELRDLWTDNHYRVQRKWQRAADRCLEKEVLSSAAGLVTVSEPWAEHLRRRYALPVQVVYNGFEPCSRSQPDQVASLAGNGTSNHLVISHFGQLYGERRDPGPLFHALRLMGKDAERIRVRFYGGETEYPSRLARTLGVERQVEMLKGVTYDESLRLQTEADVLLLLMWDVPQEAGVLPAKLFEYMSAGRPILAVGAGRGAAANLIVGRRLGSATSDPPAIARQLSEWLMQKERAGHIPALPPTACEDFRRRRQVEVLSNFLESLIPANQHRPTSATHGLS